MPYFFFPTITTRLAQTRQSVYINNRLWRNVELVDCENMSGIVPGRARLRFPLAFYGAMPVKDGDFVRVNIELGWEPAPIFRGYVVAFSQPEHGEVFIDCLDERGHFNDEVYDTDYNVPDKRTGVITTNQSTFEIFQDGYDAYRRHQVANGNTEFMQVSLRRFPDKFAGEQNLKGMPHGVAIQQVLEDVGGGKWRLALQHFVSFTRLVPFEVGAQGQPVLRTIRGTAPLLSRQVQPDGHANVDRIQRREDAGGVFNRLRMSGRTRMIETVTALTEGWDQTIEAAVLANPDKFTQERILEDENPNYQPGAKDVGRIWKIPQTDDTWTDANGNTQGSTRHPRIFPSEVVQTNPQDSEQKQPPFLIFKYSDDADFRYRDKGFTIKDHSEIQITDTKDFIRQIPFVVVKGKSGAGLNVATPQYQDLSKDFVALGVNPAADDFYLVNGSLMVSNQVASAGTTKLRLTDADPVSGNDLTDAPSHYTIFKNFDPNILTGTAGAKQTATTYLTEITSMTVDEHVGQTLILGSTLTSGDSQYTKFRILSNTSSTFTVDQTIANDSTRWRVASDQTSSLELPTDVRLNFAYESDRRLFYDTGAQGDSNQDRAQALDRDEFRWESTINHASLAYASGVYTVTLPETTTDVIKDDTEMQIWADDRIEATKDILKTFRVELPATHFTAQVGMQFQDNFRSTGTNVVGVQHTMMNNGGKTILRVASA